MACDYCCGIKTIYYKDNKNYAFINSKGSMITIAGDKPIRFSIPFCPMCGRRLFANGEDRCSNEVVVKNGERKFRYNIKQYIKSRILKITKECMSEEANAICDIIVSELDNDQLRHILHKLVAKDS